MAGGRQVHGHSESYRHHHRPYPPPHYKYRHPYCEHPCLHKFFFGDPIGMNKTYPYQSYKSVFDYINSIMFFIDSLQRINHTPTSCMNLFFLSCVFWYFQSATSVSLELPLASLICLKSYYAISPRRWQD